MRDLASFEDEEHVADNVAAQEELGDDVVVEWHEMLDA